MNSEGDVVLIYHEEKALAYARIERIEPDIKKDWYQVTLLLLTFPPHAITWILREAYINGETFTMDGHPRRLEKVARTFPVKEEEDPRHLTGPEAGGKQAKVISFKKQS